MRTPLGLLGVAVIISACGPGVTDVTYPILGGYRYSDAGGPERSIYYEGDAAPNMIVVDARVDKYRIVGNRIIVARRPELITRESSPIQTTLSDMCEHWSIDTVSHRVVRLDETSPEASLPCYTRFDNNSNPRE